MGHPWLSILEAGLQAGFLPGDRAHARLSSYKRPRPEESDRSRYKESAVLLLLYPDEEGHLRLILIQRPGYQGVHSDQMAFPGGKKETHDPDLQRTAMRETEEEIGVDTSRIKVMGTLSELTIPPSGFIVTPFVGHIDHRPPLQLDPQEVAGLYEAPLHCFLGEKPIQNCKVRAGKDGVLLTVPAYLYEGKVIWGATAMMLSELSMLLEQRGS